MNPVKIVLIEDNKDDAELTMLSLKSASVNNEIEWLRDGEEAIQYLDKLSTQSPYNQDHPHLILLDLKMPKIGGLEVLKHAKKHDAIRHIPVVVMTSSAEMTDLEECYNYGANSYVVKPIQFDDFTKKITEIGLYWTLTNMSLSR
ncbi:response regulator [Ekhidna sp.]|uniref:response regulator n=1 Tax=Ekhidna sp. TaxID=2608089 RepID=UPI003296CBBE